MRNNFCSFLSFNASPYFQLKQLFHIYFFIVFFFHNARKSCAPFVKLLFPNDKFLHRKSPNIFPFSQPPPQPKNPPENVFTLPNNHYYM